MLEPANDLIAYSKKLEFFLQKIEELKNNIISKDVISKQTDILPQHINDYIFDAGNIDVIIKILDPTEHNPYFSIDYFYQGLNNSSHFDNKDSILFIMWILSCMLVEKFFISENDKAQSYLEKIMSGKIQIHIKNKRQQDIINIQLGSYHKDFINLKLPFLLQQQKIKLLNDTISEPEGIFNTLSKSLKEQEKSIEDKLDNRMNRAEEIQKFIAEQKEKLNFVGLSSAFKKINDEKTSSKNMIMFGLIIIFCCLLYIPITAYENVYCIEKPNYYMAIPFTVMELLLLYVFRLFYQQYLFVKSELLQINLRYNLCAFIENYMEFKKENKDNTVDLFEQLVFSNIISDEKKVPATVDGLDCIANIIQSIKK